MPARSTSARRERPRAAAAAVVGALVVVALAACGGEDEPSDGAPAADRQPTATVAQPPSETAPAGTDAGASSSRDKPESEVVAETETEPEACPDVVITPDSGNGLFEVVAEGITCEDASAALAAWGRSGYPGEGPQGFACREATEATDGPGRLRCVQEASGAVVEFETGN